MDYIVFDMEFTVLREKQHEADILEIGAIKLSDEGGQLGMVDLFHTYVRPASLSPLSLLTTQFTGITQEQVDTAPYFNDAVISFRSWLGSGLYYLCSWGPDDKHQMVRQCTRQRLDLNWFRNYNDIQLMFTRLQGRDHGQRWGLKKALKHLEFPFIGKQHNALDDAFNTAKLFSNIFPQLQLERNNIAEEPLYSSKLVYTSGSNDNPSPFGKLAELLGTAI
jgi:inhibitor of KinA sporulation pathway (predicted exonuclease)